MALVDHLLKTLKKFFLPSGPQKRRQRTVSKKKTPLKRSVKTLKGKRTSSARAEKAVHSVSASSKKRVSKKKTVKSGTGSSRSSAAPKGKAKKKPEPQKKRSAGPSTKKKIHPAPRTEQRLKKKPSAKAPGTARKAHPTVKPQPSGVLVGEVTHYFSKIQVCVLKVTGKALLINDRIFIRGRSTDFQQTVRSMQVESLDVKAAQKGQMAGLKVDKIVKIGDKVYKE